MPEYDRLLTQSISRRTLIKGLTGLALLLGGSSCTAPGTPSTPAPVATPRPLGSIVYTYHGHTSRVTSVAWSPDGKRICSGSLDTTVRAWDATTGKHSIIYRGHTDGLNAVAWSPNNKRIASASLDKTAQVWDAITGARIASYRDHTDSVTAIAWSPTSNASGSRIATASLDTTARVWDADTGSAILTYHGHASGITAIAWSPDGTRIASASFDKTVQIWSASSGALLYTYRGHAGSVTGVSWSPDGTRIASSSADKTVQVWESTTGNMLYTYRGYNVKEARLNPGKGVLPDLVTTVAWSPNGRRLAAVTQEYCGDECGVVLFWDAATGRNISFYLDVPIYALAWSPDDKYVVTAIGYTLAQVSQAS